MECNKDEARRAKEFAEDRFMANDFLGAKKFALKAQSLYPMLEGIDQLVCTMDVYISSNLRVLGQMDWYTILSIDMSADDETVRKKYKTLALLLHPDKNKSVGAAGAFHIVKEAYMVLSDKERRTTYDKDINKRVSPQKPSQVKEPYSAPSAANNSSNFRTITASKTRVKKQKVGTATAVAPTPPTSTPAPGPASTPPASTPAPGRAPVPTRPPPMKRRTFWTSCERCKMLFQYYRVYLGCNIRCTKCHVPFTANEVPAPPAGFMPTRQDPNKSG